MSYTDHLKILNFKIFNFILQLLYKYYLVIQISNVIETAAIECRCREKHHCNFFHLTQQNLEGIIGRTIVGLSTNTFLLQHQFFIVSSIIDILYSMKYDCAIYFLGSWDHVSYNYAITFTIQHMF